LSGTPTFIVNLKNLDLSRGEAILFAMFECLDVGHSMVLSDIRNPQPIRAQLESRNPGGFVWVALENGPLNWQIKLTRRNACAEESFSCCSGGACGGGSGIGGELQ